MTSWEKWILNSATYERIDKLKVPVADLADGCRQADFAVRMGSGGARVAREHGYVGCVVDGPIRDTQELVELGFPVFGTSICADSLAIHMMPPGKSIHFEIGKPIAVAGTKISPGDAVVADNDGLIAID